MAAVENAAARLQETLRRKNLDALLVAQPENRRYLSGFAAADNGIQESAGVLLVPKEGGLHLLTDSRFTLQAEAEAPECRVHCYRRGPLEMLESLAPELGLKTLGFEADYCLFGFWQKLQELAVRLGLTLAPTTNMVEDLRVVKSPAELDRLRAASRLNDAVFQRAFSQAREGMSERKLARLIENTMLEMGAERPSFETIVAFGENAARPHAVPGERRLKPGETVLVDMGLVLDGYCSDMSRTFVLGEPDALYLERHRLVRAAQKAAVKAVRAGVTGAEADRIARETMRAGGYPEAFGHGLGHGVGLAVHEAPRLSPSGREPLAAGMVVTVEPGLYLADWGGIRLENMVIVTEEGCELLNADTTFLDI